MNKQSIQRIVKGCQNKDSKYQRLFVEQYAGLLYAICLRYMGNREDANDQLQIGLFKILEKINKFDPNRGKIESWIATIVINTCLSELRKNKLYILPINDETINTSIVSPEVIDKMTTEEIINIVQNLPSIYREIFNLIEIDGFSHKEAAQMLDIKLGSSRSRLARSKEMLRVLLIKNGYVENEMMGFQIKNGKG